MEQENLETQETTEEVIDKIDEKEKEENKEELKTFTEEEVLRKLQSETDRVRTEYTKKIKDMENKIKELTPVEKTPEQIELEQRIKALEDKEKEISKKELELKVSETLENNGLPKQLSKYLNLGTDDVESYVK
ncbi:DUF4355 domain-containing protein, partial [Clostridium sp.]|uniref:capsid assembly scaffolding protein Gp46 family protein n=1 Tax=Clostridium sp. TaxID=1506 RepID=UPI00359F500C